MEKSESETDLRDELGPSPTRVGNWRKMERWRWRSESLMKRRKSSWVCLSMCVCLHTCGVLLWSSTLHCWGFDHRQWLETNWLHTECVLLHSFQDGWTQLRTEGKRTGQWTEWMNDSLKVFVTTSDQKHSNISLYLALAEGEAGVNVLTVNSVQEAAAPVERWLLLPRLELTEQLTVHLHG